MPLHIVTFRASPALGRAGFAWGTCREKARGGVYPPVCSDNEPEPCLMLGATALFEMKLKLQLFVAVRNPGHIKQICCPGRKLAGGCAGLCLRHFLAFMARNCCRSYLGNANCISRSLLRVIRYTVRNGRGEGKGCCKPAGFAVPGWARWILYPLCPSQSFSVFSVRIQSSNQILEKKRKREHPPGSWSRG